MSVYNDFLKELSGILSTPQPAVGPKVNRSKLVPVSESSADSHVHDDPSHDSSKQNVGGRLTSEFGMRIHPITEKETFHKGVDIGAGKKPTYAVADGQITVAKKSATAGNMVVLEYTDSNGGRHAYTYMHLDSISVKQGQNVKKGQQIGIMGDTGNSKGVHLHLEYHYNGTNLRPSNAAINAAVPGSLPRDN